MQSKTKPKWVSTRQTPQIRLLLHGLDVSQLKKWQQNPIPRQDCHQIFTQTVDKGGCLQTFMKLIVPRRKGVTLWDAQLAISETSLLSESFSFLHSQFSSVLLSWKAATFVRAWKKLSALNFYCLFFFFFIQTTHLAEAFVSIMRPPQLHVKRTKFLFRPELVQQSSNSKKQFQPRSRNTKWV